MPLESATYISGLVATNPSATDGCQQGDDHIRLIKSTLQTTFPNINGAVTATAADLSNVAGLYSTGVLTVAAPSGFTTGGTVTLKGATGRADVSLVNSAGRLSVVIGGVTVCLIDASGNITATGWVNGTDVLKGGFSLLPYGCILQWSGSLATVPSGWHLCDGTSGTPNLRDKFIVGAGSTYVPAQTGGAVAFSVSTNTAGIHTHGGATGNAGGHGHGASTDSQGLHAHGAATAGHSLSLGEMPYHDHGVGGVALVDLAGSGVGFSGGGAANNITFSGQGSNTAHAHGISYDGAHGHNVSIVAVGDHAHAISSDGSHQHTVAASTLPPYYALAYIMKTT